MKKTLLTVLLLAPVFLFSQTQIEYSFGINKGLNQDQSEGRFSSNNTPQIGQSFSISIDNVKFDWLTCMFAFSYDTYKGEFSTYDYGPLYSNSLKSEYSKSFLNLSVYPINQNITKFFQFNVGLTYSRLFNEYTSGIISTFNGDYINETSTNTTVNIQKDNELHNKSMFGASARLAFELPLTETIKLTTLYQFYRSFRPEFYYYSSELYIMRQNAMLGLKVAL